MMIDDSDSYRQGHRLFSTDSSSSLRVNRNHLARATATKRPPRSQKRHVATMTNPTDTGNPTTATANVTHSNPSTSACIYAHASTRHQLRVRNLRVPEPAHHCSTPRSSCDPSGKSMLRETDPPGFLFCLSGRPTQRIPFPTEEEVSVTLIKPE
jgi:hypothetical protein